MVMHLLVLKVPFVPTPWRAVQAMLDLAMLNKGDKVYDLGAGNGRVLIAAKKRCPGIRAIGCERVFTIWLIGKFNIFLSGRHIRYHLHDLLKEDVRDADVVFVYVGPAMMKKLQAKFERELKPGTRIVSYAFQLPDKEPQRELNVTGGRVFLYVW